MYVVTGVVFSEVTAIDEVILNRGTSTLFLKPLWVVWKYFCLLLVAERVLDGWMCVCEIIGFEQLYFFPHLLDLSK